MYKFVLSVAIALGLLAGSAFADAPVKTDVKPAPVKTDVKPAPVKTDVKPAPVKINAKPGPSNAKPAPSKMQVVDQHPPRIGVVAVTTYVTVYRWPYGYVTVPVVSYQYIVVVWSPVYNCYGYTDALGLFHPYYGPFYS